MHTVDFKQEFIQFREKMLNTEMFQHLATIKEDSKWHREENILVHTNMVVDQYMARAPEIWYASTFCGAVAALFHDVGKPKARTAKVNEQTGETRYIFAGHEQISARIWERFATSDQTAYPFTNFMVYDIGWMIEHHVPWSLKDKQKRRNLALTANAVGRDAFVDMLLSDQHGRISDNHEQTLMEVDQWIKQFHQFADTVHLENTACRPTLTMLIGPSGSGKSTWWKDIYHEDRVFSMDKLRHQWYDTTDYDKAWKMSVEDKTFDARAHMHFNDMVKVAKRQGSDIVCDNTNLTRKFRNFYVHAARQAGMKVRGVLFFTPFDQLVARQTTRPDKNVPVSSIAQQYYAMNYPQYGEFDEIVFEAS